ncbi:excalibur calcium-binding domain-containing protein [Streptomyces sp. NPDC056257]|uniref:excalibur calcium-binding domain-containing protein n=1 Tax=Streptomyces sp. NPDC056257 TaxID=3345765 RepID=UPI0035D8527E
MSDQNAGQEFRRRYEEASEARRKAGLEERKREKAEWEARQRERRRADARASCATGLGVFAVVGLIVGGAWWALSAVASWWEADAAAGRAARERGTASAPTLPPPDWKLSHAGVEGTKTATLWTDMHETATLPLLQHESAEDTRSTRRDELDDFKGLSANDVELTVQHAPEHGTLALLDGTGVYTPADGFQGRDHFDYTIKLRDKPELRKIGFTVEVGLSPGARYREEYKYENCTAARAAGAAPLHRGEDGYGRHLDADSDGVACE